MTDERVKVAREQVALHRAHRRATFEITDAESLKMPRFPWKPLAYYELLYVYLCEQLFGVGYALADENRVGRCASHVAHEVALTILEELGVADTDVRLKQWRRECATTHSFRCAVVNRKLPLHAECRARRTEDFESCPNAAHYKHSEATEVGENLEFCVCAVENTIMLCNDLSHRHCARARAALMREQDDTDSYRDRLVTGQFNQNIVAVGVLGHNGSRDRWMTLRTLLWELPNAPHSVTLVNEFDHRLRAEPKLIALRCCIATFTFASYDEAVRGKPIDRELALLPHTYQQLLMRGSIPPYAKTVRDAEYLDAAHPHHARVDARRAADMTLTVLLFLFATESSAWLAAWTMWYKILVEHCNECEFCRSAMIESLAFLVMCFSLCQPTSVSSMLFAQCEALLRTLIHIKN